MLNLFHIQKVSEEDLNRMVKKGHLSRMDAHISRLPTEYIEFFLHIRSSYSDKTLNSVYYKLVLLEQIAGKTLKNLTSVEFDNLILQLESRYTKNSIGIYIAAMRLFFKFMLKRGYMTKNPIDEDFKFKSDYERVPFFLRPDVIKKIFELLDKRVEQAEDCFKADGSQISKDILVRMNMIRLAARLLADTGSRISEIKKITSKHIVQRDDGRAICRIYNSKVKNGGDRTRKVLLSENTVNALQSYLKLAPAAIQSGDAPLIAVTIRQIQYWISDIRDELFKKGFLEVKKLSPHDFRRFYGTQMIANGVDHFTVSKLMGQNSPASLRPYIDISEETVVKCYDMMK